MFRHPLRGLAGAVAFGAICFSTWSTALMSQQPQPLASVRANPLLTKSPLPFEAPPFDRVRDADFEPAFEAGIRGQLEEIAAIAGDPSVPSFENTLVALEKSGQLLRRVGLVFNGLASANTNPALQKVQQAVAPKLAAQEDAIFLNPTLFKRVEAIHARRGALQLDAESSRLVDYYYRRFVRSGARLSDADKVKLRALNEQDASLSARYISLLLAAAKNAALVAGDAGELAGLSKDELEAAAQAAKSRGLAGKWLIPVVNTTQQPILTSLETRATRERLFRASWTRAELGDANDTRQIITTLAELRARKAGLLGCPSYAAWVLEDQMAKTPAAVDQFLERLIPPATARAREEARDIQALIDQQRGGFALEPWDWDFYAEQVRKARFDLDGAALMPYFELDRVLRDGVFFAASGLYGLTFNERHDIPVYHKDVRVFEVFDRDGTSMALFYGDFFARDNKNGGAWMDNFVIQSKLLGSKPVIYNVGNFAKPAPGQPALISLDDVMTMFHEFGHALHGLFADQRTRACRARTWRATSSNCRPSSTSTGRSNRRCSRTTRCTTRQARRCRRPSRTESGRPRRSTRATASRRSSPPPKSTCGGTRWRPALPNSLPTPSRRRHSRRAVSACPRCPPGTAPATSFTSGRTGTRPGPTPTCGPRCSTTTPSRGSRSTAG